MERSNRYRRWLDTGENVPPVPDRRHMIVHKVGMSLRKAREIKGFSRRPGDGRAGMPIRPPGKRVQIEASFQQRIVVYPPITPSFPPPEHVTTYRAH
jgi:hypothetical protein